MSCAQIQRGRSQEITDKNWETCVSESAEGRSHSAKGYGVGGQEMETANLKRVVSVSGYIQWVKNGEGRVKITGKISKDRGNIEHASHLKERTWRTGKIRHFLYLPDTHRKKKQKTSCSQKITIVIEVPNSCVNIRSLRQFFTKRGTCTISSTRTKATFF